MSAVGDAARVSVTLADVANTDGGGKLNLLGAGWGVTSINQQTGVTAPQSVVVQVDVPPRFTGATYGLSLQLVDASGQLVHIPGKEGAPQALRISQVCTVDPPRPAGVHVPRDILWSHTQLVLNLANGIPVRPGELYTWFVELDGERRDTWAASFFVAAPPASPVVG